MASNKIAHLGTQFSADPSQHIAALKQIQSQTNTALARVHAAHNQSQQSINRVYSRSQFGSAMGQHAQSIAGLRAELLRLAPALAAAFSVGEAVAAADTWTRFSNSLKVAGLEGQNLAQVQEALFASAQKNGVALEPLSQLYGRAAQSATTLGASQADLLKFTEGVTNALRVQGGDAASASGALMQLAQGLGAGVIRAEEFNSINEGARPILEAVAAGSDKYGGSVAKLRAEMLDGKLTSQEFFQAFNNGSKILEEKAANATMTFSASLQVLQNALVKYVGEADQSLGATAMLGEGIRLLAENLDHVIGVIATVGLILVGKMAPAMAASTQAFVGNTLAATANTRAAIAMAGAISGTSLAASVGAAAMRGFTGAMTGALALVGGPLGVALIAITAAFAGITAEAFKTSSSVKAVGDAIDETKKAVDTANAYMVTAKDATKGIGTEALVSAGHIKTFAGEVGEAAKQLYRLAAAKKASAVNDLMLQMADNDRKIGELEPRSRANRRQWGSKTLPFIVGEWNSFWSGGESDTNIDNQIATLRSETKNAQETLTRLLNSPLDTFADEARTGMPGAPATKDKKGKSGPTAEEITEKRILFDLENKLAVAQAANDKVRVQNLEDQIALIRMANEFEELGYDNADQRATDLLARIQAARELVERDLKAVQAKEIDPTFRSSDDRMEDVLEPLDDAAMEMRDRFRWAIAGGLESAIYDGWPGLVSYMGDTLKRRFIENLADLITQDFFKGGTGGGGKGGGILSTVASIFGGFREHGGPVSAGKAYIVGEKRPEVFVPGQPGTILPSVPNFGSATRSIGSSPTINIQIDANDAVLASTLRSEMVQAVAQGMQVSQQQQAKSAAKAQRNRLI